MSVEIRVPTLGESVTEATVAKWLKKAGDAVAVDEPLVELETDKVSLEVPASVAGKLGEIKAAEGSDVEVGALLGTIEEGAAGDAGGDAGGKAEETEPASAPEAADEDAHRDGKGFGHRAAADHTGPAARKIAGEKRLDLATVEGTGPKGNVTKGDVLAAEAASPARQVPAPERSQERAGAEPARGEEPSADRTGPAPAARGREERVKMTRLRKRIAERLKEAQNTAAMLTTFNEVDMSAVIDLRKRYKDRFVQRHGVKLGFMSFFVKACCHALKEVPEVNAEIDGQDIVYKNYVHMGVAVGTPTGLVVPVVRDADQMGFAAIEKKIGELGLRARD
ncbi:MAG: 2-oxo acid dehydrogenase subunit E2, partial [Geminicoccaceae bacterium]|nr:2-oxo acid dehydrogenase subunit E2 [Geminicoccaceae bacterium]